MSFYKEKIIQKPRKQYYCEVCVKPITGVHILRYGADDEVDGWFKARRHIECHKEQNEQCEKCKDNGFCSWCFHECYLERMKEQEQIK